MSPANWSSCKKERLGRRTLEARDTERAPRQHHPPVNRDRPTALYRGDGAKEHRGSILIPVFPSQRALFFVPLFFNSISALSHGAQRPNAMWKVTLAPKCAGWVAEGQRKKWSEAETCRYVSKTREFLKRCSGIGSKRQKQTLVSAEIAGQPTREVHRILSVAPLPPQPCDRYAIMPSVILDRPLFYESSRPPATWYLAE